MSTIFHRASAMYPYGVRDRRGYCVRVCRSHDEALAFQERYDAATNLTGDRQCAAPPSGAERSAVMLTGTLIPRVTRITDGAVTATVKVVSDSFVIATTDSGAEVSVARADERWGLAFVRPTTLNIVRDWVVYDANGNRVDGYKFKSRALRNNKARFAGTGFWLGQASTGRYTWVDA